MRIHIKCFAKVREIVGKSALAVDLPAGGTVRDVMPRLDLDPSVQADIESSVMFAVNHHYVEPSYLLQDGDELAIIPPVSGG